MVQASSSHNVLQPKLSEHHARYALDVSQRAIVGLSGKDGLDLLQRLSTNDVANLIVGKSVQTVLTNEKGKIVEVISVLKISDSDLLLVGNTIGGETLHAWLDKYIIMEDATIENQTGLFAHFLLFGTNIDSSQLSKEHSGYYDFVERFGETSLHHLLCPMSEKEHALSHLDNAGYRTTTGEHFIEFRVKHGIPAHPNELSLEYNPMEAGLLDLISFTKGCYIGQEVIARLDTYKKVQKRLTKFELGAQPETIPVSISSSKEAVGVITSVGKVNVQGRVLALGYIRTTAEFTMPLFFSNDSQLTQINIIS